MEINDIKKLIAPSEMMTEDGKNELYLYSFKKNGRSECRS